MFPDILSCVFSLYDLSLIFFCIFVIQLVFGNCGVLQGIGPGKAYVDMSTVDIETVADIHEVSRNRFIDM